jgi:Protein of unknown function (DUF2852)
MRLAMSNAANDEAYADRRWAQASYGGRGPWRRYHGGGWRGWNGEPTWIPPFLMGIPKPVLIILMVAGFIFWWPVGLVLLALMIWRKRAMWCGGYRQGAWQQSGAGCWSGWKNWGGGTRSQSSSSSSSGNRAFDEYRAETLKRLEEEQKEFGEFLERLRFAKDKSEFDQFMDERRNKPPEAPQEQPSA